MEDRKRINRGTMTGEGKFQARIYRICSIDFLFSFSRVSSRFAYRLDNDGQ